MILVMTPRTCVAGIPRMPFYQGSNENLAFFSLLYYLYLMLSLYTILHFSQPSRVKGGSDFLCATSPP